MSRSSLRRALGALVSVTFVDASGREVQVTGTLDEVGDHVAVVRAVLGDVPIDGRLWIPAHRLVSVQEPEWR